MKSIDDVKKISIPAYINSLKDNNKKTKYGYPVKMAKNYLTKRHNDAFTIGIHKDKLDLKEDHFSVLKYLQAESERTHKHAVVLMREYADLDLHEKAIDDLILYAKECGIIARNMRKEQRFDEKIGLFKSSAAHYEEALNMTEFLVSRLTECPVMTAKSPELCQIYALPEQSYDGYDDYRPTD